MPVYEYECTSCGTRFEKLQSVGARPPRQCPTCGERSTVRRLVTAPAFHFRGTGWYVTDYAGKGKGPKTDSEGARSEEKSEDRGAAAGGDGDKPAAAGSGEKTAQAAGKGETDTGGAQGTKTSRHAKGTKGTKGTKAGAS